jgi:hypothetical protein
MSKNINQPNLLSTYASHHNDPRASFSPSTFRLWTFGLMFIFSLLTIQCGLDVEDPTPPSPPVWVQKSLPEEWPERGIDAHESGAIYFEWEPSTEDNISAYSIYRAQYYQADDSLGKYEMLDRLDIDGNISFSYIDSDVDLNTEYYYRLKVEDDSGNRSNYSDSLGFSLLHQIKITTMMPNGLEDVLRIDRNLSWYASWILEMEDYCLTIAELNGSLIYREVFSPENYENRTHSKRIPPSVIFEDGVVYIWRIDTGARYISGLETAASESLWATFLYVGE